MRIVNLKNEQGSFKILTENEMINISFDLNHPELILEDNSMIIFDTVETYYHFIGNADLYSAEDNSVSLESLLSEDYLVAADTVNEVSYKGYDISVVYELVYEGHHICYIQRTGINPLAI